ncbi:MAG TPA: efflux RND transporter periplasmic adaptor subunit, partial [Xanthobacteraceae bacterium]|nr:efflux RND transporter periplasmic adaptor subunit [Xanthobacteraceae bacterium]
MTKRMVIMLIGVAIVLGAVFGFQAFKAVMIKKFMASMAVQTQTVSATRAGSSQWQPQIEAVGSLRALNGADLSLEVSGVVDSISFQSGDDVKEGDVLLKLRSDDDAAKLQSLQAVADLNEITYERDQKQFKLQAVSQATIDTDVANLKNAKAQVMQQQAILDKKTLHAPFAGHLGIRAVDLGQYLSAGTTIVTLQALDPIFMDFFVPQQAVDQIRIGQRVNVKVDAYKDRTFAGEISALNPRVDASSRNVQIRATLK